MLGVGCVWSSRLQEALRVVAVWSCLKDGRVLFGVTSCSKPRSLL